MSAAVAPSSAHASAADALSEIFSSHPPAPLLTARRGRDTFDRMVGFSRVSHVPERDRASGATSECASPSIPEKGRSRDGYTAHRNHVTAPRDRT
eukprot:5746113-Prymnesium_polylepis.1